MLVNRIIKATPQTRTTLSARVRDLHSAVKIKYPFITRIALALYEADTDLLRTFLSSTDSGETLVSYEVPLSSVPSLAALVAEGRSRVVRNIPREFPATSSHTRWLIERGYLSSYTVPVYHGKEFVGFLFFDASTENEFTDEVVAYLDLISQLLSQLYLIEVIAVRTLVGVVRIANTLSLIRDQETGAHLQRIAHFAKLIARQLASSEGYDDEFVEHIFLFAPLHDVGKIGIPDRILLKTGKLDDKEREVMQKHVTLGVDIIDHIIGALGLDDHAATAMMRNVVACHHEVPDGSGYPLGLRAAAIAPEARIIAVADVFDALTSDRPYKKAWSNDEAFAELRRMAALQKLDPGCVSAFFAQPTEIAAIQAQYR